MFQTKICLSLTVATLFLGLTLQSAAAQPAADSSAVKPKTLTLDECLELALRNNKTIQADQQNIVAAKEAVRQAEGGYLPTLGYAAAYNNTDPATTLSPSSDKASNYYSGTISATVPWDLSGKLGASLKLAQLKLASVQETLRKDKQTLIYNVKNGYYQVWLAERQLEVQRAAYDNLDRHYQQVRVFFEAGTRSKYNLFQAQVQRDTIKPKIMSAENTLALSKLKLATEIGLPGDQDFTVAFDASKLQMPNAPAATLGELLAAAYQNRPELRQYQQNIEMSKAQTQLDAAGKKPAASLSASYKGTNRDLDLDGWNRTWNLTVGISGNFYDGGVTKAKVAQDKATEQVNIIKESDLRDQIRLGAEQVLQNLGHSIEVTRANQASIDLAKETLEMTQARYEAGMATTMDIMDAEVALDTYLDNYYQGIVTYLAAVANLDLVAGKD